MGISLSFILLGLACSTFAYPVSRDDSSGVTFVRRGCCPSKLTKPRPIKLPPLPDNRGGHAYDMGLYGPSASSAGRREDDRPVGLHGNMIDYGDPASKKPNEFKIPDRYVIPHIQQEHYKPEGHPLPGRLSKPPTHPST
ncbi:hypothetical protein CPB83DRAFT_893129 [Crepidotus variabilis]|uniref:Uncharacterized protein n=1 Tax=Crepidotus variabilis TaxID=179855 RepID=A0A9P6EHS2_9AGAR|nr:hypothetical protein CPB83DRAFT_893129 [Crepidotus variabilis]